MAALTKVAVLRASGNLGPPVVQALLAADSTVKPTIRTPDPNILYGFGAMSSQLLVITGVSGHMGFRVLVEALSRGYKVRAVIRNASQADRIQKVNSVKPYLNQVEFSVVPDLLVEGAFDGVLDGADGVAHVASPLPSAEFKRDLIEPAVNATLGILKAAKKVATIKRVVITSSIASLITWDYLVSSDTTKVFTVRDAYAPTNLDGPFTNALDAYGVSKAAALDATERFKQEEKPHFEVISILPSMVTGKNELNRTAEERCGALSGAFGGQDSQDSARGGLVYLLDSGRTRQSTMISLRLRQQLQDRRARGRRAQREFRQRQIDTINELRASQESPQAAIASIARAAAQQDSAGMTEAEPVLSFVDPPTSSVPDEPPAQESTDVAGVRTVSWELEPDTQNQFPPMFRTAPYGRELIVERSHHQSGRMSPTLEYGLFLGPEASISIEYPPMDIIPYLQDGASLATTVFWTSLSWGFQILGAALAGNVEAMATTQSIFTAIISTSPGKDVLNGIHARLTYRKTGTIDRDHPGNHPEQAPGILARMTELCEDNGTPLETFLTPIAMEDLLRNRLGTAYDVIDRTVQGYGSPEEISRLRKLVQMMTVNSICLGDGPRWSIDKAEDLITYWTDVAGIYSC
ncbi:hypothetical protein FCIRC_3008 [Fusarium circinatum]|uniref:NAD-dependent epimerase/dehydratase domain-containing protein n=1 Tax=Fusarium circinatum TaxID=48490 RepID=A0A8H5U9A5_FUSCI|nr:hypothetical protein FCIRC_3008 [Fusarium circinatum]